MTKKIINAFLVVLLIGFTSCNEEEVTFDADGGQTGLSFARSSINIGSCDPQAEITVESTTRTNADRTFSIVVNSEATTGTSAQYTVPGSVTIPAGEFLGSTSISIDFDEVTQGAVEVLVVDLVAPENSVISARGQLTVNYTGVCTENLIELSIAFDSYPEETAWQLYTGEGTFIAGNTGFGVYAGQSSFSETFCLPDGDYFLRMLDQFGDGLCCAYGNGSVSLDLSDCDGNTSILSLSDDFTSDTFFPFSLGN